MALLAASLPLKHNQNNPFPPITSHLRPSSHHQKTPQKTVPRGHHLLLTRRTISISLFGSLLFDLKRANAFDFGVTTPDQTVEEAESGIRKHAQSLLQVKDLLESSSSAESWKDAQKALRKRASYLKQDIYTIIQSKPGSERPQLRKLYSFLFNSVSDLDYAARDRDTARLWECYGNIVVAVNDILSRI